MAWACASMSGGGTMASLLVSSSVAAISAPSFSLNRKEEAQYLSNNKDTHEFRMAKFRPERLTPNYYTGTH
jgi:hypothetical protein